MTRIEAQALLGIRDLDRKEIAELRAFAEDVYERVRGPHWRERLEERKAAQKPPAAAPKEVGKR